MIPFPAQQLATEVQPRFPVELCCNCGAHADLRVVPTKLLKITYLGVGGIEKSVTVSLPYCGACEVTATRIPKTFGAKILVSLLVVTGLMLAYAVAQANSAKPLLPFDSIATVFWLLAALSLAVVFGGYALRRPRGSQTSWYQPVRLVKLRQKFLDGTIVGYVFAFTNAPYRQQFASANAEAILRRVIDARAA